MTSLETHQVQGLSSRGGYQNPSPSFVPTPQVSPVIGGPGSGFGILDIDPRGRDKKPDWSALVVQISSAAWRIAQRISVRFTPKEPIDGDEKKRRGSVADTVNALRISALASSFIPRRNRRFAINILVVLALFYLLTRSFLSSPDATPTTQTWTQKLKKYSGPKRYSSPALSTDPKGRKKLGRTRSGSRVPLPPGVVLKASRDHPIEKGLLRVNLNYPTHPIYQLIRDARNAWDEKVAKQSKTLREAITEYRRRYKLNPPKGFDKWWAYVVENDVQLPDEYDQIHRDLFPFRALSPKDLNQRIEAATQFPDTYTIRVKRGNIRTSIQFDEEDIHGAELRLKGQTDLLENVVKYIGDFSATYSVHDTPSVVVGYGHRRELIEHAEDEEYVDDNDEVDLTPRGWPAMCPINSPIRHARGRPRPEDQYNNTRMFIADHSALMDICNHPNSVAIHGALSGQNPHVSDILPLFSLSKTVLHADILGVPTEQYVDDLPVVPWAIRDHEQLLWRGSNTGAHYEEGKPWKASHRIRLLDLVHKRKGELNVLSPPKNMNGRGLKENWRKEDWAHANKFFMDVEFTGEPIQCEEDGSCQALRKAFRFVKKMSHDEALRYKYVLDVDGNAWSARFQRLLLSGSMVFKSTIMPEWWTDRMQPWVHYVPVQVDYSDLYDALAFFRGSPSDPDSGEDALAREIAEAGRDYVQTHWRKEDMTAYVFRLYLEWARLSAPKRWDNDLDFNPSMEMERQ